MTNLKSEATALRQYILERAHAVGTTSTNLADGMFYRCVKPVFIAVDGAAKATEGDTYHIFNKAWEKAPAALAGDHRQASPVIDSSVKDNCFALQGELSLFARLTGNGHKSIMLREQHRMNSQICKLVSDMFYEGDLLDHPSVEGRILTQLVETFNNSQLDFADVPSIAWLDKEYNSTATKDGSSSTFNPKNINVGMKLLGRILSTSGIPAASVKILVFYTAQFNAWTSALMI